MKPIAVVIPLLLSSAAVAQPATDQPDANQPAMNQPATNQPEMSQPAMSQPAMNQPAMNQPAMSQPAMQSTNANFTPPPGMTAIVPVPDSAAPGGFRSVKITTPASNRIIQPDNKNPRRDRRGVLVMSDPAVVPEGWNGVTGTAAMGGPIEDTANVQTVPTSGGLPLCSATITDRCKNPTTNKTRGAAAPGDGSGR
jgi:pentapeptide MXKDX repeat protein